MAMDGVTYMCYDALYCVELRGTLGTRHQRYDIHSHIIPACLQLATGGGEAARGMGLVWSMRAYGDWLV